MSTSRASQTAHHAPRPLLAGRGRHVVLLGFMGAGKTTVGRRLAERLGARFLDLDAEIERRAGKSVAALFASEGEAGFRARESALLVALADELADAPRHVIATGGGVVEGAVNHGLIARLGARIWLTAPFETLLARLRSGAADTRPLAAGPDAEATLAERFHRRLPHYARADATVDAAQPVEAVVAQLSETVDRLAERLVVDVPVAGEPYEVAVGAGALDEVALRVVAMAPPRAFLVVDREVRDPWAAQVEAALRRCGLPIRTLEVQGGDAAKDLSALSAIWDALLAEGADRDTVVVAIGGGVATDLAGFAAATALRGLRIIHAPTTVLAMADASVGGKTAINHPHGKNLVGAFHQPRFVACDPETWRTLPVREARAGVAEIIKIAAAHDRALFEALEGCDLTDGQVPTPLLARAIALKAGVVAADARERGLRRTLNFGHTVGHAIERALGYGVWLHGEAVALGLVAALRLSVDAGVCPVDDARRVARLLDRAGLPTRWPASLDPEAVAQAIAHDKKRHDKKRHDMQLGAQPGQGAGQPGVRFVRSLGLGGCDVTWVPLDAIPVGPAVEVG